MTAALSVSPLACWLIGLYQRYISPRKGFRCAYRARHTRRDSCSQYARRAIAKLGLLPGIRVLGRRFGKCSQACKVLHYEPKCGAKKVDKRRESSSWADCAQGCDPWVIADVCDAAGAAGRGLGNVASTIGDAAGSAANIAVETASSISDSASCGGAGGCADVGSCDVGGCDLSI